jgi:hypothetical protein
MNTNPWLEQKLNEAHQRDLREFAERQQAAQVFLESEIPERPRRQLLTKLRAGMQELMSQQDVSERSQAREVQEKRG